MLASLLLPWLPLFPEESPPSKREASKHSGAAGDICSDLGFIKGVCIEGGWCGPGTNFLFLWFLCKSLRSQGNACFWAGIWEWEMLTVLTELEPLFIVNRRFCQVAPLYLLWRPSTYFKHLTNKLGPDLCLPGLAALQIPVLIDTQLVVWLGAVPITPISQAWQADRPPPSNTIIPSKHQTSIQLWCGSWARSLKRGIFGTPFALFLTPEIAAVSQQPSNWVLSMAQGIFREYFAASQQTRFCWRIIKGSSSRSAGTWAVKIIIIRDGEWVIGLLLDHLRHLSEDISPAIRRSWAGAKGRQREQCCSREGFVSAYKAFFSAGLLGFAQVSSQIN